MKKNLLLLVVLLCGFTIKAQNISKEEALELMANDTCECIKKKEIDPSDSMDIKQMELGICLIASFNKHKSKSKFFADKGLENMEEVGEMVGMTMSTICLSDFLSIFSTDEIADLSQEDDINTSKSSSNKSAIEVELSGLYNDALSYIITKDSYNKQHIFLIKDDFEGYDLLKTKNVGQSYRIHFKEESYFDLSERNYVIKKIITKVEAL